MSRGDGTVREIVWNDIFPGLLLIRSLKLAVGFRLLVLAGLALYLISVGWWVTGKIFQGREDPLLQSWIAQQGVFPWHEIAMARGADGLFHEHEPIDVDRRLPQRRYRLLRRNLRRCPHSNPSPRS